MSRNLHRSILVVLSAILTGCPSTPPTTADIFVPENCQLAEGLSVEVITIDTADEFLIVGNMNVPIRVKLSGPAPSVQFVCLVVRDQQVPVSMPITMAVVPVPVNLDHSVNFTGFRLGCDADEHVVASASAGMPTDLDSSTRERRTRIFVQHIENADSFRTLRILLPGSTEFTAFVRGLNGTKSNRVRAKCRL